MISEQRIRELIALGNENRNLDYKGAFSWATATKDEKCELVKDVLAFANTRDGGTILVGVNDKTGVIEGLTDEQYTSFDQTKFNDFVHKYTDPRHTSNIHRRVIEKKKLIVIEIPEFSDVPVLCNQSVQSGIKPSQLILRQAGLYKRTDKATSQLIEDADEMRDLLNRGLFRRQDELLRAFKQIMQPQLNIVPIEQNAEFRAEIESASQYFGELGNWTLPNSARWLVSMQPEIYIKNRISTAVELQQRIQNSAISLRGWTFPIVGRVSHSVWTNFDGGSQSVYSNEGQRPEAIRAYKSGLLIWCSGLAEEYWQGIAGQNAISFVGVIYSVTEWMLFAKRYFESLLSVEDKLYFKVMLFGATHRRLISADPSVMFPWHYEADIPSISVEEVISLSDLRADAESVARRIVKRIFELFNWNDPDEQMLYGWQQKLIQQRF